MSVTKPLLFILLKVINKFYIVDYLVSFNSIFQFSYFQSVVGISKENFEDLYNKLSWKEEDFKKKLIPLHQLLITMIWLRLYSSLKLLSWIFKIDISTISRYILNILDKLYDVMETEVYIPEKEHRLSQGQFLRRFHITMVLDGTEQKIVTSTCKKKTKITFSGKKKSDTFTKLVGVGLDGQIWYLSPSYGGHLNDLNLVDLAENSIYSKFLTKEEWIIADRGFNGQIKRHILSFNYFKNTEDESVFLKYRSVVENSIAKIKKWQICSLKF